MSCPCCAFLPDDLFLPKSRKDKDVLPEHENEIADRIVSPQESLRSIAKEGIVMVDTHGHAHLQRGLHEPYQMEDPPETRVISLSCSVEPKDWGSCLRFASQSKRILPGLGVHPWYLAELDEDYLGRLEELLQEHPHAVVGEIGLCKMAKFLRTYPGGKAAAMEFQRTVFVDQLRLAHKYRRPVTVHCVQQHGVMLKLFQEVQGEGQLPAVIGLHSFSGTAHHVRQLLNFEANTATGRTKFYFGFSHIVNFEMCSSEKSRRQGIEAIRAVPKARLMVESDVHSRRDVAAGTAGAVAYVALALGEPIGEVAQLTARNGLDFLNCIKD